MVSLKRRLAGWAAALCMATSALLPGAPGWAQALPDPAEAAAYLPPSDADYEDLAATLAEALDRPLDLNTAEPSELLRLPFVSPEIAADIRAYRRARGGFGRVAELARLPSVTPEWLAEYAPFFRATPPAARRPAPTGALVLSRYRRRLGPGRTPYGAHALSRFEARAGGLGVFGAVEKDAGEPFLAQAPGKPRRPDYWSGGLALGPRGALGGLVVGDFDLAFGQGILYGYRGRRPKSYAAARLARRPTLLRPHTTSEENLFLRGIAGALVLAPGASATAFLSSRRMDAPAALDSARPFLGDYLPTGLHLTSAAQLRAGELRGRVGGVALQLERGRHQAGALVAASGYRVAGAPPMRSAAVSLAGAHAYPWAYGFWEVASAGAGRPAALVGAELPLSSQARVAAAYRFYPDSLAAPFGRPLAEYTGPPRAEEGFYLGAEVALGARWRLAAYLDQHRRARRTLQPMRGQDALLRAAYAPLRWLRLESRLRTEVQEAPAIVSGGALPSRGAAPHRRSTASLHLRLDQNRALSWRAHLDAVRYKGPDARAALGRAATLGVAARPAASLRVEWRTAAYDAPAYDARVYVYEPSVRYAYGAAMLYGRGLRHALLAAWTPRPGVFVEAQAAAERERGAPAQAVATVQLRYVH